MGTKQASSIVSILSLEWNSRAFYQRHQRVLLTYPVSGRRTLFAYFLAQESFLLYRSGFLGWRLFSLSSKCSIFFFLHSTSALASVISWKSLQLLKNRGCFTKRITSLWYFKKYLGGECDCLNCKKVLKDSFLFSWHMISLIKISILINCSRDPSVVQCEFYLKYPFLPVQAFAKVLACSVCVLRWNLEKLLIHVRGKPDDPCKHPHLVSDKNSELINSQGHVGAKAVWQNRFE